ncbi:unnamed protein product [Psylliodes chrysocephalus]|uniref:HAT C-terminal dimerisation domain-containing protein n=1 Tax=Psylliodes chrysocephalus TaxID=3402493 RepID=A0A9P0CGG4_9CUCU|nr:unnamed protein product [Psylliodes chrysocephala]
MIKKLDLFLRHVRKNKFDSFLKLKEFLEDNEETLLDCDKSLFLQHLDALKITFREYFPLPTVNNAWIRNPYSIANTSENEGLTALEEEQFIKLSTDGDLKSKFDQLVLEDFWVFVKDSYPELSNKALNFLIPFSTTYLCETLFSALLYIKNKYGNSLKNVKEEVRLKLSKIKPNIDKLVREVQAQGSH